MKSMLKPKYLVILAVPFVFSSFFSPFVGENEAVRQQAKVGVESVYPERLEFASKDNDDEDAKHRSDDKEKETSKKKAEAEQKNLIK